MSVEKLLAEYRRAIADWGALGASGKEADRVVPRFLAAYHELVKTAGGREAIDRLRGDEDPWVRMVAASHSIPWAEAEAREVLVALRDDVRGGPGSDALLTLMQIDNGTYQPP